MTDSTAEAALREVVTPEASSGAWYRKDRGRLVDHLGSAVLVAYILLTFEPFGLFFILPGSFSSILLPAAAVGVLLITPTDRIRRAPLSTTLLALTGWWTATLLWSELRDMTMYGIRSHLVPLLLVAVVVGTMRRELVVTTILRTFVAVGIWSLVTSLLLPISREAVLSAETQALQHGFRGTFIHKNLLGVFVIYGLAIALPFFRSGPRRLVLGLGIALVLLTRSATAVSGLMALLFTWFWIRAIDHQRSPRERQFMAVLSMMAVFSAIMVALGLMPTLLGLYGKDFTFSGRTDIWAESMVSVAQQPAQGYGYLGIWFDETAPLTRDLHQRIGFGATHSHNGLIELLLQVGVIGAAIMLVFLGRVVGLAVWAFNRREHTLLGQWALLTMVSLLLMSISEPLFAVPHLGLMVIIATVLMGARNDEARAMRRGRSLARN